MVGPLKVWAHAHVRSLDTQVSSSCSGVIVITGDTATLKSPWKAKTYPHPAFSSPSARALKARRDTQGSEKKRTPSSSLSPHQFIFRDEGFATLSLRARERPLPGVRITVDGELLQGEEGLATGLTAERSHGLCSSHLLFQMWWANAVPFKAQTERR